MAPPGSILIVKSVRRSPSFNMMAVPGRPGSRAPYTVSTYGGFDAVTR
jgi:hypothetical protein